MLILFHSFACKPFDKKNEIETDIENPLPSKGKFQAQIIGISDGDTVTFLYHEKPYKLRLEHIDAPERNGSQAFHQASKKALSELCFNQTVTIEWKGELDRYDRFIGIIYNSDELNVNLEMIKRGMAWHYKQYSRDRLYAQAEKEAKRNKIGIWSDEKPIPPWEWRKGRRR